MEADFETGEAARTAAAATVVDLARGTMHRLASNAEWRLDVKDQAGIRRYSFRLIAEAT
jgi:Domain of unknown function (DUF6894)